MFFQSENISCLLASQGSNLVQCCETNLMLLWLGIAVITFGLLGCNALFGSNQYSGEASQ